MTPINGMTYVLINNSQFRFLKKDRSRCIAALLGTFRRPYKNARALSLLRAPKETAGKHCCGQRKRLVFLNAVLSQRC